MSLLGAHMSIAGGFHKALEAAAAERMETVQIFTHSPSQWAVRHAAPPGQRPRGAASAAPLFLDSWRAPELKQADVSQFQRVLDETRIQHPIAHSSYLINLASPDEALWEKSVAAMIVELERASTLGLRYVVVHPGAAVSATEDQGIANVARAIDVVHRRVRRGQAELLLENTAGQGSCLGWRFEQLAAILAGVRRADRLGVCFDTCHAFAAGYPLASAADYRRTFAAFDRVVGLDQIRAFHVNDSVKPLGSRVDRHAHLGRGQVGLDAFRRLVNDRRFRAVPMYLETPKGEHDGETWDAINLRLLRELAGSVSR